MKEQAWTCETGVCFECGIDVSEFRGTDDHPPLCDRCGDLWYGPHDDDEPVPVEGRDA